MALTLGARAIYGVFMSITIILAITILIYGILSSSPKIDAGQEPQEGFPVFDYDVHNYYPASPEQQLTVASVLKYAKIDRIKKFIEKFTKFHSRNSKRYYGPGSANEWLLAEIQAVVNNYTGVATVETMESDDYLQKNIIAKVNGTDPKLNSEIIILGAHLDSLNRAGDKLRSPGADDNASGSGVVFEILTAILESGVNLKRSLEFHWYAAEEAGLLGSDTVSESYRHANKNVIAMLNLDCLGYVRDVNNTIGIYNDGLNHELLNFTRMIADNYIDYEWEDAWCEYPCSDHATWQAYEYPAVLVSEVEFLSNRHIHTAYDTMDKLSFEQIYEICKLAGAFVVELADMLVDE